MLENPRIPATCLKDYRFAALVEAVDAHREGTFGIVHPAAPHYNTLLRVDPTDRTGTRVVGDLAHTWTITDEGRTYTLKLRKGVRFHDGSELTSRDAKASYDKIINPPADTTSFRKAQYDVVEAVERPDASTIVFRLKWPSDPEERKRLVREFERRLVDEEAHYFFTLQWHRIVPHSAKLHGWTITPSHFLNQQLDTVWLSE